MNYERFMNDAVVTNTNEDLWNEAIESLEARGIRVAENVIECCHGCVDFKTAYGCSLDENEAYAWSYAGQDKGYVWNGNYAYESKNEVDEDEGYTDSLHGTDSKKSVISFNHGNDAAAVIVRTFQEHGFKSEWDGNENSVVSVYPNERIA